MAASLQLRSPQSRTAALVGMMLVAGSLGLGGCAYQNATVGEAALRQPSPAPEQTLPASLATADFQMVDCQLPPRIHRLGTELVYLGPTRQVRTTTRDCVIRGGDFVVHDRANKAT
jgi:hypothetical protein